MGNDGLGFDWEKQKASEGVPALVQHPRECLFSTPERGTSVCAPCEWATALPRVAIFRSQTCQSSSRQKISIQGTVVRPDAFERIMLFQPAPQFLQGGTLDLSNSFAGEPQLFANGFQSAFRPAFEAEPMAQDQ